MASRPKLDVRGRFCFTVKPTVFVHNVHSPTIHCNRVKFKLLSCSTPTTTLHHQRLSQFKFKTVSSVAPARTLTCIYFQQDNKWSCLLPLISDPDKVKSTVFQEFYANKSGSSVARHNIQTINLASASIFLSQFHKSAGTTLKNE